jgi:formate dehydrogenase major subunit
MAECHPVGFQWVMEAKERGATVIHVDPRFTRTSAMADVHVPIRAGSDIAFLGGIVRHIIENEKYFRDYVVSFTNAPFVVTEDFRDTEDLDGLFSGWDPEKGQYSPASWQYDDAEASAAAGQKEMGMEPGSQEPGSHAGAPPTGHGQQHQGGATGGRPRYRDDTLQDPRCVFQLLRRHFSRYTPEMVERTCGIPRDLFLRVADALCDNSGRERTSAFVYSVGWTQHSVGVQYIRTASIIQLLLGNMGRPGGGIMALRGHASIQGSTDIPTLYELLPGYLPMPKATLDTDLATYLQNNTAASGWLTETPKYMVSLLKAYWGEAATWENDFAFDYLPRLTGDHSHMTTVSDMADGELLEGYFVMGENPAVGSMHGSLQRKGLRNLKWLVVRDLAMIETAEFWRNAPEIDRGEVRPEDIETEVFFFPAAAHTEKDGTFTNTQRLLQWHHKAIEPPEDCRSELWFTYHLGRLLQERYASSTEPKDRPIQDLAWDYPTSGPLAEPSAEAVLAEINGSTVSDGKPVATFTELKDDGSTACGCWIYSGVYADGENQADRRTPGAEQDWVAAEWGWAWPANRRILYNRASADPEGRPWSERKKYVWWDEAAGEWAGFDVPDMIKDRRPDHRPDEGATGTDTLGGDDPFIIQSDGKGWLFAPTGLVDGPLPAHYEPQESPFPNTLYAQQCNPARMQWRRSDNRYHRAHDDPRFPYVVTTYRLTEHHTAGGMSRWLTWLSELQPEMFCEVGPELARENGLTNGGWATITTERAEIECRVLVTPRIPSLRVGGRVVHQIGLPYHWGRTGLAKGDTANELISFVADPNVSIQESKALTANIEPGRRGRGRRLPTTGVFVPGAGGNGDADGGGRDLPAVGERNQGQHGLVAGTSQEGEQG